MAWWRSWSFRRLASKHGSARQASLSYCPTKTVRFGITCSFAAALRRWNGPRLVGSASGFYVLQAEIAACHGRASVTEKTDWVRIANLYAELARVAPSPVVELNRAVAVGMAFGPKSGLEHLDRLAADPALLGYHLLPSVRGDFLFKLGRMAEAREEFERAASLTHNARELDFLTTRAQACVRAVL